MAPVPFALSQFSGTLLRAQAEGDTSQAGGPTHPPVLRAVCLRRTHLRTPKHRPSPSTGCPCRFQKLGCKVSRLRARDLQKSKLEAQLIQSLAGMSLPQRKSFFLSPSVNQSSSFGPLCFKSQLSSVSCKERICRQEKKKAWLKKAPLSSEQGCLSPTWKFVNSFLCIYLTLLFWDLLELSVLAGRARQREQREE